jgi:hypothetical protein
MRVRGLSIYIKPTFRRETSLKRLNKKQPFEKRLDQKFYDKYYAGFATLFSKAGFATLFSKAAE